MLGNCPKWGLPLGLPATAMDIIHHHHERLNGNGYPDGLRASQLSLEVQLVALADIVDALLTDRVYRAGLSMEVVWNILQDEGARGFHDTHLIDQCIQQMACGSLFSHTNAESLMEQEAYFQACGINSKQW